MPVHIPVAGRTAAAVVPVARTAVRVRAADTAAGLLALAGPVPGDGMPVVPAPAVVPAAAHRVCRGAGGSAHLPP